MSVLFFERGLHLDLYMLVNQLFLIGELVSGGVPLNDEFAIPSDDQ
jgi:hypothetical protein